MITNALTYLENSCARWPEKVALSDPHTRLTYRELLDQARAIGTCLAGLLPGQTRQPIVVLIDRRVECVTAFMGVLFSGNFYAPVDAHLPTRRIQTMLHSLQPGLILAARGSEDVLNKLNFEGRVLFFEDALTASPDEQILADIRRQAIDTDPLYLMFTSGSTGSPKGVLISHRSVIDLVEQFSAAFGFSDQSVFGNQAPFDFDVSVKDIYSTFKNGASMHILPRALFSFPAELIKAINAAHINTVIWSTSALRVIANLKGLEKELPTALRMVMFSGETMPGKVLNYWRGHLPEAVFVNLYGPTEITCNCTYFIVDRPLHQNEHVPIGRAFPNTDVFLLNEENLPCAQGEPGEIVVRGTSLALGYYNQADETARAFCQNPLNPHYPELIYRTGDLGKFNPQGELLFLGRKDHQVKHMGHRIELAEIESVANALACVETACCLYDAHAEKIVLFYQAAAQCDLEILAGLRETLPKAMIPNRLVHLENLPINKNAKIDRAWLKEQYIHEPGQ